MRAQAKINRQRPKRPRTPDDRTPSEHRCGPRLVEGSGLRRVRPAEGVVLTPQSPLWIGALQSEAVLVMGQRVIVEARRIEVAGLVEWVGQSLLEGSAKIRSLFKNHDIEAGLGQ